jgi:hypothetical protein
MHSHYLNNLHNAQSLWHWSEPEKYVWTSDMITSTGGCRSNASFGIVFTLFEQFAQHTMFDSAIGTGQAWQNMSGHWT